MITSTLRVGQSPLLGSSPWPNSHFPVDLANPASVPDLLVGNLTRRKKARIFSGFSFHRMAFLCLGRLGRKESL